MEPSEDAYITTVKAGNMFLNRFCIDEDAAFELSGVMDLKQSSLEMRHGYRLNYRGWSSSEKGLDLINYMIITYDS